MNLKIIPIVSPLSLHNTLLIYDTPFVKFEKQNYIQDFLSIFKIFYNKNFFLWYTIRNYMDLDYTLYLHVWQLHHKSFKRKDLIMNEDQNNYTEPEQTPPPPHAVDPALIETKIHLTNQLHSGAGWFYWIAGLSLVNTIVFFANANISFVYGLGITEVTNAIVPYLFPNGVIVAAILDAAFILLFIVLGRLSHNRKIWAFITGMVLYGLDTLFFILVQDWLSILFHIFALYGMYRGLKAHKLLVQLESEI